MPKQFWEIKNSSEDSEIGELLIYGNLANQTWYEDDVTPKQFYNDLEKLGDIKELHLRFNSYGGDVFAGHAMYNLIMNYKKKYSVEVIGHVDGINASAATIPFQAADKRIIPVGAMMLVHLPMIGLCGYFNKLQMQKYLKALGPIEESIVNVYHERSKRDKTEIISTMEDGEWMTADKAIELGYADALDEDFEVDVQMKSDDLMIINNVEVDCTQFKNMPMQFMNMAKKPPIINAPETNPEHAKNEPEEDDNVKNKEELKNKYPDVYNSVYADGATAERTRIKNIEEIATPGMEKLVNAAKFDTPINSGELAKQIIAEGKNAATNALKNINNDAAALGEIAPPEDDVKNDVKETETAVLDMVNMLNDELEG